MHKASLSTRNYSKERKICTYRHQDRAGCRDTPHAVGQRPHLEVLGPVSTGGAHLRKWLNQYITVIFEEMECGMRRAAHHHRDGHDRGLLTPRVGLRDSVRVDRFRAGRLAVRRLCCHVEGWHRWRG